MGRIQAERYRKALHRASIEMLAEDRGPDIAGEASETAFRTCASVSGPILSSYVFWVLKKAEQFNIRHLYFLARDGKILYEMAAIFVRKYRLPVQCHYLYCSRLALRKPLYYLNKQEALEKLCVNGFQITPRTVMERSGLDRECADKILTEIGISKEEEKAILSARGLENLRERLAHCERFDREMYSLSKRYYENTIAYFRQEGILDNDTFAFVDSGWTGSMQRSIRLILEKEYPAPASGLQGFYFGIFNETDPKDGTYHCFYFYDRWRPLNSLLFNHNLFECWCMACHGMTAGYERNVTGRVSPVTFPYVKQWLEREQMQFHIRYAERLSGQLQWEDIETDKLADSIRKRVRRISLYPEPDVARVYGGIPFCDDSTESYMIPLARRLPFSELVKNLLAIRLYTKFLAKNKRHHAQESFWPEATISFLPWYQRIPLRLDKAAEYFLKLLRKKLVIWER